MAGTRKRPLKAVPDDAEPAPAARKLTVKSAADGGERRDLLVALRTRIAAAIDDTKTPPRDLAALSRRLLETARELEALDAETKVDDIGEAAATPDEAWTAT